MLVFSGSASPSEYEAGKGFTLATAAAWLQDHDLDADALTTCEGEEGELASYVADGFTAAELAGVIGAGGLFAGVTLSHPDEFMLSPEAAEAVAGPAVGAHSQRLRLIEGTTESAPEGAAALGVNELMAKPPLSADELAAAGVKSFAESTVEEILDNSEGFGENVVPDEIVKLAKRAGVHYGKPGDPLSRRERDFVIPRLAGEECQEGDDEEHTAGECEACNARHTLGAEALAQDALRPGEFKGWASTFGTVLDSWIPSIMEKGAFKKSLKQIKAEENGTIPILWQHSWRDPMGGSRVLREESKGLYFVAFVSDTQTGRDRLVLMRDKVVKRVSVGFSATRFEYRKHADGTLFRHLFAVDLMEISPVSFAADSGAWIEEVASAGGALPGGLALDAFADAIAERLGIAVVSCSECRTCERHSQPAGDAGAREATLAAHEAELSLLETRHGLTLEV